MDENLIAILNWWSYVIANIDPTVLLIVLSFGIVSYFISRKS